MIANIWLTCTSTLNHQTFHRNHNKICDMLIPSRKIWQSPKRLVDFCIFVSIQKYNPYWKMYKMFTLECQINVTPPPLVNFLFSIPPMFVWTLHVFVIPNIFFTCLDRNWGSQYKHFSIKISVIKYEENMWKRSIYWQKFIFYFCLFIFLTCTINTEFLLRPRFIWHSECTPLKEHWLVKIKEHQKLVAVSLIYK